MGVQKLLARIHLSRVLLVALGMIGSAYGQNSAPSWLDFLEQRDNGGTSKIIDYSYAGYRFSEEPLPTISLTPTANHRVFNIQELGADLRNSEDFDDDIIRDAIDAAVRHTNRGSEFSAVIYFPPGFYQVADAANELDPFTVGGSRIVLKGAGSGVGGTVIHTVLSGWRDAGTPRLDQGPFRFNFRPRSSASPTRAILAAPAERGSFQVRVQSSSDLDVGDWVIVEEETPSNLAANFPGREPDPTWNIRENGLKCLERHLITAIDGNRVTFKNPLNMHLSAEGGESVLKTFSFVEDVGVEDIYFTSGWRDDSQIFMHHENDFVDYAFRCIRFRYVKDGWIRNCTFDSWNEMATVDRSACCTLENIKLLGKKGHAGVFITRSTGILCRDYSDDVEIGGSRMNRGQFHGPSVLHHASGVIYLDCKTNREQSIDNHSFGPYANLFDNVGGGIINGNGGPFSASPSSGPDLTLWNFEHSAQNESEPLAIDFWHPNRRSNRLSRAMFVNPNVVGFTTVGREVTFKSAGLLESQGTRVYPRSLFEAQLQTRVHGTYMEGSNQRIGQPASFANDGNPSTFWQTVGQGNRQWLSLDFIRERTIDGVTIDEIGERVNSYRIEIWDGSSWIEVTDGRGLGDDKVVSFAPVRAERVRLYIESMVSEFPFSSVRIRSLTPIFADESPIILAHWPLDEGSGSTAFDVAGGDHHGNLLAGARFSSDPVRKSYVNFDGNNDQIRTPFTYSLRSSDDFTWSWWARKNSAVGTDNTSVMVGNRFPEYSSGDRLGFIKFTPTRGEFAAASVGRHDYGDITDRSWHHYTMVKDGDLYQWYVDGQPEGGPQTIAYSERRNIPFNIGGDGFDRPSENFRGDIDDVVLYAGALSAQEVIDLREGFPQETVRMALLNTGTRSDLPQTWETDEPARPGLAYLVPEDGNLWSARGDHRFPGTSLKIQGGGRFQFAGLRGQGERTTVDQLIATGGTEANPSQLSALLGEGTTNVLAGVLTTDGYTQISGRGTTSGLRNVAIDSQIQGVGTIETTSSGNRPTLTTISNSTNTFAGTWLSAKGTLIFENPGAVGEAEIEISPEGSLRIEGDWTSEKTLRIADSNEVTVEVGPYAWTVSNLIIGGSRVPPGTYKAAELNDFGSSISFEGDGFIIVPFRGADGPVARWALDEGAGSSAFDSSGNGYTGALRFGPSWRSDSVRGSHLRFDGNNDRIDTSFVYQLEESSDFTWSWWANSSNVGNENNGAIMVGNRFGGSGDEALEFIKLTENGGQFANGADVNRVTYPTPEQDGWHHFALVKSGTSYQLYLDGQPHERPASFVYDETEDIPFKIGGDDDDSTVGGREGEHFGGFIDDVVLYDRALTELDIRKVQNGVYQDFQNTPVDRTPAELLSFALETPLNFDESLNGQVRDTLQLRYTLKKQALAEGIRYRVEHSQTLKPNSWVETGVSDQPDEGETNSGSLEHRIVSIPMPDEGHVFFRLVIIQ